MTVIQTTSADKTAWQKQGQCHARQKNSKKITDSDGQLTGARKPGMQKACHRSGGNNCLHKYVSGRSSLARLLTQEKMENIFIFNAGNKFLLAFIQAGQDCPTNKRLKTTDEHPQRHILKTKEPTIR